MSRPQVPGASPTLPAPPSAVLWCDRTAPVGRAAAGELSGEFDTVVDTASFGQDVDPGTFIRPRMGLVCTDFGSIGLAFKLLHHLVEGRVLEELVLVVPDADRLSQALLAGPDADTLRQLLASGRLRVRELHR
ncbi:hypothetical protein [Micromonospora sp. NPDC023644]|uniref:hypothetical protein n=1 Tax=Micromonospora sp. NPDC023644 TaxID=3154321 RepID=UPI0033F1ED6F